MHDTEVPRTGMADASISLTARRQRDNAVRRGDINGLISAMTIEEDYTEPVIHCSSFCLGAAPT